MLSYDLVNYTISSELDPRIQAARDMSDKLRLHVDGVGLQEFLKQINGYENINQYEARKKHAISNKFITEELLRPTDNAFNARGGSRNYTFSANSEDNQKKFVSILENVRNSHSLNWYIENEWFHKFITDPNGLIVIESDTQDVSQDERNAYPTYKSIHSIRGYEQNGVYVDWVVFEPHLKVPEKSQDGVNQVKKEKKYFWAVDEINWYLFKQVDGEVTIERTIAHGFGRVPAVICSNIVDNVTGWKRSPIDAQIGLLDKYVVSNSVLNIAEFFHNYPQQFIYVDECNRCNGTGNIGTSDQFEECPNCDNGKAERKDVTDLIKLRVPKEGEQKIDPPSGFIYMPTEPWELMTKSVDRIWNRTFFSHWGTVVSREGKNETATGRYIDAQPVNNRLNKYSKSIEQTHSIIASFIGKFYFPLTFEKAFVQYGRRYLIETPDQIWEKYLDAKTQKAPVTTLDILLSQYLESEYRENEQMFVVESKKSKLEPFVHWDIQTVRQSETISDEEKQKKEYFGEWINTLTIEQIHEASLEDLRNQLTEFVQSKPVSQINNNE